MTKIKGSCLCRSIKYTSKAEPIAQVVFHCVDCQKQTGTAFSIVLLLQEVDLNISGSSHATTPSFGDTDKETIRHFCNNCGSPIYSQPRAYPGLAALKAGTLDDTSWLKPTINVYCETAQPWVVMGKGMENYDRMLPL